MKTLLGAMLFALAAQAQVHAQALEADLDGNASALQASELRTAPQLSSRPVEVARRPKTKQVVGRQSRQS